MLEQLQEWETSEAMNATQPPSIIKVAIVEDRREIRDGLAMLISGTEGFECTGTYRSMEDALSQDRRSAFPT